MPLKFDTDTLSTGNVKIERFSWSALIRHLTSTGQCVKLTSSSLAGQQFTMPKWRLLLRSFP